MPAESTDSGARESGGSSGAGGRSSSGGSASGGGSAAGGQGTGGGVASGGASSGGADAGSTSSGGASTGGADAGSTSSGGASSGGATDAGSVTDASPTDSSVNGPSDASSIDAADAAPLPRFYWQYLRIDDCPGTDDGALGYTTSSDQPVAANCDASRVGRAAVCWDQTTYHNEGSASPGCTYKTIQSNACTEGPRSGYLWVCVDRLRDGGVTDDTPAPEVGYWRWVRIGDCPGNDVAAIGYTTTSKLPLAADCTASSRGLAAVCWDQVNVHNAGAGVAGCTYKSVTAAACTGGNNPGYLYVCDAP
ncbi:MAG TPA: hypothetical protein VHE30_05560 [Polyangiaceae bacterium]|nr:hypothetical protein [Polyangiaceae bacterium]